MPDHIHIAARLRPDMAPAKSVQKVKANSSKWIYDQGFLPQQFNWQTGGGTFSVSRTHVDALRLYIKNQKAHHAKQSFRKEYLDILRRNEIEPDPAYLPDFFED